MLFSCFLFLWLLRCFTSPGHLHAPMNSARNGRSLHRPGFPIRISPGQRLLATSPKLFAGCYVLHRPRVSRHPPCALLHTTKTQNCALFLLPTLTLTVNCNDRSGSSGTAARVSLSNLPREPRRIRNRFGSRKKFNPHLSSGDSRHLSKSFNNICLNQ